MIGIMCHYGHHNRLKDIRIIYKNATLIESVIKTQLKVGDI